MKVILNDINPPCSNDMNTFKAIIGSELDKNNFSMGALTS